MRAQLKKYLDLRIVFYQTRNKGELQRVDAETAQLQNEMWSAVQNPAVAQPSPVVALGASGMNDVLNSRIHSSSMVESYSNERAWSLMIAIAIACNALIGYGGRNTGAKSGLLSVLPLVVSISFLLIADIDSPRGGFIHIAPQNLVSLAQSLQK